MALLQNAGYMLRFFVLLTSSANLTLRKDADDEPRLTPSRHRIRRLDRSDLRRTKPC
ncbi:protein of unknown function [Agrobacterium pusense]|uniref:Uncharacterized protein n=1 Tax=Agrobacterium pusense TaxID=648995 RepID=U4Q063_9HYPH|nr:protein of unknown function [Agrobacterium pusense]